MKKDAKLARKVLYLDSEKVRLSRDLDSAREGLVTAMRVQQDQRDEIRTLRATVARLVRRNEELRTSGEGFPQGRW